MVGLVVVSHSRALARAAVGLAEEMLPADRPPIEVAAGLDDETLGTDAVAVQEAVERADDGSGVVVLLDLGSAVLSAELALELLPDDVRARVVLSPGPLVEGLLAAAVAAAGGADRDAVAAEAARGLEAKAAHLGVEPPAATPEPPPSADGPRAVVSVTPSHGLHARPAARLVALLRGFDAEVVLTDLTTGTGPVAVTGLTAVAGLGARHGDELEVVARGPDADAALAAVVALAGRGFDDEVEDVPSAAPTSAATGGPVVASAGLALGPVVRFGAPAPAEVTDEQPVTDARSRLEDAVATARRDLRTDRGDGAAAAVADAHLALLDDPELVGRALDAAGTSGRPVTAWREAVDRVAGVFAHLPDDYLRERAADVRDVGDRVLRVLTGAPATALEGDGVLVADDLTPTQAAALDPARVHGVVLVGGSPTSHAAVLVRAHGLPMLVGAAGAADVPVGTPVLLDADASPARFVVDPDDATRADAADRLARRDRHRDAARAAAAGPATTRDGVTVTVLANAGSPDDARAAADAAADGLGLVRTEFLFLGRDRPPPVDEQLEVYRAVAAPFDGRRVVFRTLDLGGDKPAPYAPVADEANPFLGVRGVRLALRHPRLLADQLRALVALARERPLDVMVPMVSTPDEVRQVGAVLDEVLDGSGRPDGLRLGVMVEVPALALRTATVAPHVDFLSIGTNDLTQYALAAERGNPGLNTLGDALDPGVLALVDAVVRGAGDVPVSVCGEIAADPAAVPVLVGLGVRTLSVAAPAVADVKQGVRTVTVSSCAALASEALRASDAAAVRALVAGWSAG